MPPKRIPKATDDASPGEHYEGPPSASETSHANQPDGQRKSTIPPDLLAKLFKTFMEDEATKTSAAATKTVAEYMHLFLTEAVYRAVSNRRDGDPWAKTNAGLMLEVDDLEKITPQLLLDF